MGCGVGEGGKLGAREGIGHGTGTAQGWALLPQVDGTGDEKVSKRRVLPCALDETTQKLVALIFSSDMFRHAMQAMNIGRRCRGGPRSAEVLVGF